VFIDTTTPAGRVFFNVMASLAQMERELTIERTQARPAAARAKGRLPGRKRIMTESKTASAKKLLADGTPPSDVARDDGVSIPTLQPVGPRPPAMTVTQQGKSELNPPCNLFRFVSCPLFLSVTIREPHLPDCNDSVAPVSFPPPCHVLTGGAEPLDIFRAVDADCGIHRVTRVRTFEHTQSCLVFCGEAHLPQLAES
jgi:hypothetical protein